MTAKKSKLHTVVCILLSAGGLLICAFGLYLTIRADIGVLPWDTLNLGIAQQLSISYGTASVAIAFLVILIDVLLKERIGVGTIFDAVLVGKGVDFFAWLDRLPELHSMTGNILLLLAGLVIVCVGQVIYMRAGLCCGPRDTLMVALGKRVRKVPIGAVNVAIFAVVLGIGWAMGAPVGIGTVISTFGNGFIMQGVFRLMRFEPRDIVHEDILQTGRALIS